MNKQIISKLFKGAVEAVEKGLCPCCGGVVNHNFRDAASRREFEISGLCQVCQDAVYKGE